MPKSYDNYFILSDIHGRRNCLLSKSDYKSLTQAKNIEELIIKLNHYFEFINENMTFTIEELRKKLYDNLIFELSEFANYSLDFFKYFMDYNRILAFYAIIEIGDNVYYTGTVDEFKGLSSCRSFGEAIRLYINNTSLEKYFYNINYNEEYKDNNLQKLLCKTLKNYFDYYFTTSKGYFKEIMEIEGDRQIIEICINGKSLKEKKSYFPIGSNISDKKKSELCQARTLLETQEILNYKENPVIYITNQQLKIYAESFKLNDDLSCVYAYFRLKEQEMSNIIWIAECIIQNNYDVIDEYFVFDLE